MPIVDGEYQLSTADQIEQTLRDVARQEDNFGSNIDLTPNSVFSSLFSTMATVQEDVDEDIQDVYQSAFLDTATGVDLDRVVAITGVTRREAQRATGYVVFANQDPVSNEYVVAEGTRIDTASSEPTRYRTTEQKFLAPVQTFEENDLSAYSGDTASFTTQSTTVYNGTYALESTGSGRIFIADDSTRRGDTYHVRQQNYNGSVQFLLQNADDYYEVTVSDTSLTLELSEGGTVTASDSVSVTYPQSEWGYYEIDLTTSQVSVTVYDSADTEIGTVTLNETTYFEGGHGFAASVSGVYHDFFTMTHAAANVESVSRGAEGNSGRNALVVLPTPPNGVDSVTNPEAIGDPQLVDVTNQPLRQGQNEETDEQLRSRVRNTLTSGGAATTNAIISSLVNNVDGVTSVSVFENKTDSIVDGLPPYSFECVVLGGNSFEIASEIFDTKAVTAQDVGGVNGTEVVETITAINGQQFDISFSRPSTVSVTIDVSIATTDTYIGDDSLKDMIVNYIGGQTTDGTDIIGLGVGENVYIDEVENIIVGADETGVRGIDDANTTYSPTTSTDGSGLEIISVADSEVATIDATDITITHV